MKHDLASEVRNELALIIVAYSDRTGDSVRSIGRRFYGDGDTLPAFLAGKTSMTVGRLSRLLEQLSETWPRHARWPKSRILRRPKVVKKHVGKSPRA